MRMDDNQYVIHNQVGNFTVPVYVSEIYNEIQDYLSDEFEKSEYNTGNEADEELFYSYYNIQEVPVEQLDHTFSEGNGTGFVVTTEIPEYIWNTELQVVHKDPLSSLCKNDKEAAQKASDMGIGIIPEEELPDNFAKYDSRKYGVLDTKANREALEEIEKNMPLSYIAEQKKNMRHTEYER